MDMGNPSPDPRYQAVQDDYVSFKVVGWILFTRREDMKNRSALLVVIIQRKTLSIWPNRSFFYLLIQVHHTSGRLSKPVLIFFRIWIVK